MLFRLQAMVRWADIVHLTAVYSAPTIPTLLVCNLMKKPVVWSPRGALQRWDGATRQRTKKIWELTCNALCDEARVRLHYTSAEEQQGSERRIARARGFVIPNGVDQSGTSPSREWQPGGRTRLLYLGRLHPIKGIENLLRAMTKLEANVTLAICGEGEPTYSRFLMNLADSLMLGTRVNFMGAVEGEAKDIRFREADVCVVPSYSENFGMVVAEALMQGVPVIAGKGTPWKKLEAVGAGLWVDNDPDNLSNAISLISHMPLAEMGNKGQGWMAKDFGWSLIAEKMAHIYDDLLKEHPTVR